MGTKNNPGKFDCYTNAEPDEPMFVLLGRDPLASLLVRFWIFLREDEDPAKVAEARTCADALEKWAIDHGKGDRVKEFKVWDLYDKTDHYP